MSINITEWIRTTHVVDDGNKQLFEPEFIVRSKGDYVNGGITFNFPVGLYTVTPYITVSVCLKNASYLTSRVFKPVITAESASSVTIRVNRITLILISEAATDDVTVTIHAIGQ